MKCQKIELSESIQDVMVKMSNGNPGAIPAIIDLYKNGIEIDPDSMLRELGPILYLDSNEIYGSDIYILWNDKCDRDVRRFIMLLRACKLGIFSNQKLKQLSLDQMRKVNITEEEWKDIEEKVLEQLPNFKK